MLLIEIGTLWNEESGTNKVTICCFLREVASGTTRVLTWLVNSWEYSYGRKEGQRYCNNTTNS